MGKWPQEYQARSTMYKNLTGLDEPPFSCSLLSSAGLASPFFYFTANNYQEARCEAVLQEMRRCCAQYPKGRSICCSGFEKEEGEREKLKAASNGLHAAPQ
ncbi:hypothetical protein KIL84_022624 [Mauremys mutica]|uniref:Cx9C motif-containing protein 4, mitochondrial n=1 Tax=Mauremys mutica TaxID=74926 RepID=A0A9D3WQ55_9SAUR|nr:hypothetical protein KIL84_022624 [Mauremys mutica]